MRAATDLAHEILRKRRRIAGGGEPADRAEAKGQLLSSGALAGFLAADPEAWFHGGADPALAARIEALIAERIDARAAKDWARADIIRAELTALNVEVQDSADGASWKLKERA